MWQLIEWILDASVLHIVVISFKFDIVCCQALLQVKENLCKCNNLGGYFLHRYQKPRARTNEVSSTERKNSICLARGFDINFCCKQYMYYVTCIFFAWMKSCFVKMSMQISGCYQILFIYYDFIIGNKKNSAPGMERLSSKNPYRRRISSVSKKESWLYNKWYQFWQISNIFDWVRLVKFNFESNKLFSPNKTLIRKQKNIHIWYFTDPYLIRLRRRGSSILLFISILFFNLTGSTLWAATFT